MSAFTPAIILILLALVVPEAATGSTPLSNFLNPAIFVILFIAYGLAVLVIREFFVRMRLGMGGLFLLGLAYGFLNEGLFAKTLLRETGLPMAEYDTYGYSFGVSIAFALAMTLWHAVSSVMFPILAVHALFPAERERSWLSTKVALALTLLILAAGLLLHFDTSNTQFPSGTVASAAKFLVIMALLTAFASRFKARSTPEGPEVRFGPVWLGVSTFIFLFIGLNVLIAGYKLPLLLYIGVYALGTWFYIRTLRRKHWDSTEGLLLFALGCYLTVVLMGFVLAPMLFPGLLIERIVTELLFLVGIVWLIRRTLQH